MRATCNDHLIPLDFIIVITPTTSTHLQLVRRSRKCGSLVSLPHTPLWSSA
jgi:hypothetical protein